MCNPDVVVATLEQVAELVQLDPTEVAWAIEQYGRCDTDDYTVVLAGHYGYVVKPR